MLATQEAGSGNTSQRSDEEDFVKVEDLPLQMSVMCEVRFVCVLCNRNWLIMPTSEFIFNSLFLCLWQGFSSLTVHSLSL